jgi:glycerophosphoryl diester phosphodiesterase
MRPRCLLVAAARASLVLGIVALVLAAACRASGPPPAERRVLVVAHRGEHRRHPENTLPAFEAALDIGADFIEVDVRTTADGKLVIFHDRDVARCTDGSGDLASLTWERVRRLDVGIKTAAEFAGTRVPSLEEVLHFARGRIRVYLDVKSASAEDVARSVGSAGMTSEVVVYGSPALLSDLHRLRPEMPLLLEARDAVSTPRLVPELRPVALAFGARDFTGEAISLARRSALGLFVDRVGELDAPAGWQDAIDRGATAIQTDRPEDLVEYLASIASRALDRARTESYRRPR